MNRWVAGIFVIAAISAGCAEVSAYRYWNSYTLIAPVPSKEKIYNDENINIRFWIDEKKIHFLLRNLADEPIVIDWGKSSFVDIDGRTHAIANQESIFSENRLSPSPTTIPAKGKLEDYVAPAKNAEKLEEWTWYLAPMFDLQSDRSMKNRGKTFRLDLVAEIGGEEKKYAFEFEISIVAPYTHLSR